MCLKVGTLRQKRYTTTEWNCIGDKIQDHSSLKPKAQSNSSTEMLRKHGYISIDAIMRFIFFFWSVRLSMKERWNNEYKEGHRMFFVYYYTQRLQAKPPWQSTKMYMNKNYDVFFVAHANPSYYYFYTSYIERKGKSISLLYWELFCDHRIVIDYFRKPSWQ